MIAFEVSLNGKRVCCAGAPDFGVLSTILTWVRRRPCHSRDGKSIEEEMTLDVGGLQSESNGPGEHLRWLNRDLHVGDKVSVQIIDTDKVDEPPKRFRDDPVVEARAKRRYYEELKREFEGTPETAASKKRAVRKRGRAGVRTKRKSKRRGKKR